MHLDEMKILREAWDHPDPPSPHRRAEARAALLRRAARDRSQPARQPATNRWRPSRRLVFSATVVTTAIAVGFALVQLAPTTPPSPEMGGPGGPAGLGQEEPSAGHQILLAAAETALEQPAGVGDYWYVEQELDLPEPDVPNPQTLEVWTAHDGRQWTRNACCPDLYESSNLGGLPGFQFARSLLTYEELQGLPTDGEQLKAWIADSLTTPVGWPSPGPGDAGATVIVEGLTGGAEPEVIEAEVALELANLLYRVPAPPEIRATAYRALATMPEVASLGRMDGGEGLRITIAPPAADKFPGGVVPEGADSITVVIDPETSQLLSITNYQGTVRIHAAEWTDQLPAGAEAPADEADPAAPPPGAS